MCDNLLYVFVSDYFIYVIAIHSYKNECAIEGILYDLFKMSKDKPLLGNRNKGKQRYIYFQLLFY